MNYDQTLITALEDSNKISAFISYIKSSPEQDKLWLSGVDALIDYYGYTTPAYPLLAALLLSTTPNGTKQFIRHKAKLKTALKESKNEEAFLFYLAQEILRTYHESFAQVKKHTHLMLTEMYDIDCESDDDIVEWLGFIIRDQQWRTLSLNRILNFSGGKDEDEWFINSIMMDLDDNSFKPYIESEEEPDRGTIADKLKQGMRTEYYAKNRAAAGQSLKEAITMLKTESFTPDKSFKTADWYLEMISANRYSECCDLADMMEQIHLDKRSLERILAQVIAVAIRAERFDSIKHILPFVPNEVTWDLLAFNLACYYATLLGDDEELMYKYIETALKTGKSKSAFDDSDFDAYRHTPKFKMIVNGGTAEDAELQAKITEKANQMPESAKEAEQSIAEFAAFADATRENDNDMIPLIFDDAESSDETPGAVPMLDAIMAKFGSELSAEALVSLFELTFSSMSYSNYQVALDIVEEIIKRRDIDAEIRIARAFFQAGEYYDAGHRLMGGTVQDQLIDDYFPRFEPEALCVLLEEVDTQYLAADDMHYLFVTVLENKDTTEEMKQHMYKRFLEYYAEEGLSFYYNMQFEYLFKSLLPLLPEEIKTKIKEMKAASEDK